MANEQSDSFIRWQSATREHFTLTSSVVLGLSTGLLAFVSERLLTGSHPSCSVLLIGGAAVLLLVLSIGLALWCSINRLRDFRATAQIARRRDRKEQVPPEDRLETKILGERSWLLFWWQLTFFGFGAAISAIALLMRGLS
jgi:hypothetical protein